MPDPLRPLRRLTQSHALTRAISHLTVVGLVTAAAAVGISHARGQVPATDDGAGFFSLIATARGAAGATPELESAVIEVRARPQDATGIIDRDAIVDRDAEIARVQVAAEPLATPVPVDPDATPLPGPVQPNATGGTTTNYGTSTRLVAPSGGTLAWPVPAGSISQYFHSGHLAIDIAASYGSSVVAAEVGVVSSAGWRNNGGGYVVEIDHGNGMRTVYNHLGGIWVSPGQTVARGDVIAPVGCTGMCTGPHVHFEVIVNGVIVNPLQYL